MKNSTNSIFLNKVLFNKLILKIKNEKAKKYFLSLFLVKNILIKLLLMVLFSVIIFPLCFGIREYYLIYNPNSIVLNSGIAFSQFENASPIVVYFIQILPIVASFIIMLFLVHPLTYIGLIILLLSGLCNVIDRALGGTLIINNVTVDLLDKVIDYIKIGTSVCNVPDILVISGSVLIVIGTLFYFVKYYNK